MCLDSSCSLLQDRSVTYVGSRLVPSAGRSPREPGRGQSGCRPGRDLQLMQQRGSFPHLQGTPPFSQQEKVCLGFTLFLKICMFYVKEKRFQSSKASWQWDEHTSRTTCKPNWRQANKDHSRRVQIPAPPWLTRGSAFSSVKWEPHEYLPLRQLWGLIGFIRLWILAQQASLGPYLWSLFIYSLNRDRQISACELYFPKQ